VRHILIVSQKDATPEERDKARTKAVTILQRLKKGEDFAKLAVEVSEDPISAPKGGELAAITIGKTNSDEFEKAAFSLKPDEVSEVVATSYGFHIIKMDERQEMRIATFEEARDFIHNKLKTELEQKKAQEFVQQTAKDAGMEVYGDTPPAAVEDSKTKNGVGSTADSK